FLSLKGPSMFRRSTRHSPFWAAATLLALLAAPHTLLAQDAPLTVRADVTNGTAQSVEVALVGPDGKDLGPPRSVLPGRIFHSSKRTLPGGSAKGYKWVVRYPGNKRVLKEVPAGRALQRITVGITRRSIDVARGQWVSSDPEKKGQGAASGQNQAE